MVAVKQWTKTIEDNTYALVPIKLTAMETPNKDGYIFGATYQDSPCGCKVEGCGTLPNPLRVSHCKRHRI